MITRTELNPVSLIPNSQFVDKRLIVTTTMDSPKERATLSKTFICLKKTKVQAKPGKKNTNMKPSIALMIGKRSMMGKTNPRSSLIGDSQSTLSVPPHHYLAWTVYTIPLHQYLAWTVYDFNQY